MPITVSDVLNIDDLKNMKLITGQDGLNVTIKRVGILDYEFINKTEGQFGEGDFVISSFLFAKDDINLLIDAIKSLIKDGVACLAIKDVYYKELPDEIVEYANKRLFPIFLFDNNIFYEDLITYITDMIRTDDRYQFMEAKIENILHQKMNKTAIKETALEINKYFKENFIVIYLTEKKLRKDDNIFMLLKRYNNVIKNKSHSVFKYKNGILAVMTQNKIDKDIIDNMVYDLISDLSISTEDFYVAISKCHENLNELDIGVNESLYAIKAGEVLSQSLTFYNDIGLYKIILPFIDEYWVKDFYEGLILLLHTYDDKNSTEFLNTAVSYIDNNGNIKATADALFQHENTIRYRINKIKEILNMEKNHSFYEQLSAAVKIYKILNKKFM